MQDQAVGSSQTGGTRKALPPVNEEIPAQYTSSQYPRTSPRHDTYYQAESLGRAAQLAKALGWFSIGLGLAQLLAPRGVSRLVGTQQHPRLVRALGTREILSGVGILSQRQSSNWLWTRVAGDAMDLALLGMAARSPQSRRRRINLATAAVAGVAVLDVISSMENARRERIEQGKKPETELHVTKSITVNRPAEECYRFWHDFESFPRFMQHLEAVKSTGDNRTHWRAKGPAGTSFSWDAELIADEPNQYLAWRSIEGSGIDNAGSVRFERAPGGHGTIVRVELHYVPPAGMAGAMIAKLFGEEPSQQIDEDLRRFKWLIETGEIPTTVGQPSGPRGVIGRLLRKGAPG
ncbi:SRPBCC family protein [Noviherbaspirillum agri]